MIIILEKVHLILWDMYIIRNVSLKMLKGKPILDEMCIIQNNRSLFLCIMGVKYEKNVKQINVL